MINIEDLWINDCQVEDWKEVDTCKVMTKLSTIYLERNPIYRDQMYRKKVMMTLPQGDLLKRFYHLLFFSKGTTF